MSAPERAGLLEARDADGTTSYNRLKQSAQNPNLVALQRLITHLKWVDALGDTRVWMDGTTSRRRWRER